MTTEFDTIDAYPLRWPESWPRTDTSDRKYGRFGTRGREPGRSWSSSKDITIAQAVARIKSELSALDGGRSRWERIDPGQTVISTNLRQRNDGLPYSNQRDPEDPGAALYFEMDGKRQCIPCDSYTKIAQNLAAIAATIEALRTLERHGSGLMERAFTGFTALPPPIAGEQPWYEVLQVPQDALASLVRQQYHQKRRAAHPDHGGSSDAFDQVQKAWLVFKQQRGIE
tara:strand:- start:10765 stop:11445 length:681 start_codon:yes stop_codon:yes gene_type:complete